MTIRRAGAEDATGLHALAAATFALACPPGVTGAAIATFVSTVLSTEQFVGYLADPHRVVLVDIDDGALTGYTMLVLGDPDDPEVAAQLSIRPTCELSKCYALPTAHGTGRAGRLLEATLEVARREGRAGVWLGVNQHNLRAQRFYGKHGFARIGVKQFLVGDRLEDDFVLERRL